MTAVDFLAKNLAFLDPASMLAKGKYSLLCSDDKVLKEVLKKLTSHGLSMGLEKFEIPKQIYLTSDPWTPDSGLVTAAMKLKRKEIENRYAAAISQIYAKMTTPTANKIDMNGNKSNKVVPV